MLHDLHTDELLPELPVKEIAGNPLFREGVEYSSPARGTWTIAHVTMLIPESHQIFVGGNGCLRGVVLSAAEFGGLDRFSMITITEQDVFENSMERIFIDGITDILQKLPVLPPAVVVFRSCIHEFMGCDMDMVYRALAARFPSVDFIPSSMNPTMRKSGMTPEELMRQQLYAPLGMVAKNQKSVNIIGNCFARNPQCELVKWLTDGGYTVRDICTCASYAAYKLMAESSVNIYTIPLMEKGAHALEQRIGQEPLFLPLSFDYSEIERNLTVLQQRFHLHAVPQKDGAFDYTALEQQADEALAHARTVCKDMVVAIDYAAVTRPLGLAQLLIEHGFSVARVYADAVLPGEDAALAWLKEHAPALTVHSVVNFQCRFVPRTGTLHGKPVLAIGQKAAYFCGTDHFVNIVENGDLWGFTGISELARLMEAAALSGKNMRDVIQVKAWGCCGIPSGGGE